MSTHSSSTSVIRNLQLVFLISTLLLIISIFFSVFSINKLVNSSALVNHTNETLIQAENLIASVTDAETAQRGFLLTHNESFLELFKTSRKKTNETVFKVKELTIDNTLQQDNIRKVEQLIELKYSKMENVIKVSRTLKNQIHADTSIIHNEIVAGKEIMDDIRTAVLRIKNVEKDLLSVRTNQQETYTTFTPLLVICASLISILITLFSFIKIKRDLNERVKKQEEEELKHNDTLQRISKMESITKKISLGNYAVRSEDLKDDELGRVSVALNTMCVSLEKSFNTLKDKNWLQEGFVKIGAAMRGERNLQRLCSNLINNLVEYLNSPIATLYTNENGCLTLSSSYSITQAPKRILIGEGLIGQAAKNQTISIVEDIPAEFLIESSLGKTLPVSLVIVPLVYESETIGVIEIGLFRKPEILEIEFLSSIVEPISIGLNAAMGYIQLQNLLEETQVQTEELQTQHSELENLNTELEAQTQRLQASEEELRVQQEELQETNAELEERSVLLEEKNHEIMRKATELETTTRYKSEFLANMSHELRTPLNSILLLSRLLTENTEKNLSNDQIEYASVIHSSGNGLLGLIDEILDLSKIEAGKMELDYMDVPIKDIAENMNALFKPIAKEKRLDLKIHISPQLPYSIQTDKIRLEQVLKNLLSNALKFTANGSVSLEINKCLKDDDFVCFKVQDSGIGIASNKLQFIFEAFQQADGTTRRKYGGTGLGLSISRELTKLLGGEIQVSSILRQGSEFTLRVPFKKPSLNTDEIIALENKKQIRKSEARFDNYVASSIPESVPDDRDNISKQDKIILIVEDDVAFAKTLTEVSRKNGFKVISSVRGDEALALALKYKPIGILLDIQLPVKSGWEVIDELKKDSVTRHIPVHMMSSYKMKNESLLKGAIDFINKPMVFEQIPDIFKKIEHVLNRNTKKILIIEDTPKHATALAYYLETYNVKTEVKDTVAKSVEALKKENIDCVILDSGIPDADTWFALSEAKKVAGLEDFPIIIFTGKNLSLAEEHQIKQFADTIVVKTSHSYQRMLDEVSLFLNLVDNKKKPEFEKNDYKKLGVLSEILKDKTVLIVDDDVRNIFSLTKSLEKTKIKTYTAINGKEALQKLEQHKQIDVVLLDMMMPEMDGYETAQLIRKNEQWKNLPIIAITAKAMAGDREKCISSGASDYITKPVDMDQLLSLLRVWLYDNLS